MFCRAEIDVRVFADAVLPWLAREPTLNNVVSTLIMSRTDPTYPIEPDRLWLAVSNGELRGVAVMTPPRGILLSDMRDPAARAVAEWLVDNGIRPPAVSGALAVVEPFLATYLTAAEVTASLTRNSRMFRLDGRDCLRPPTGVRGAARPARATDRDLLIDWSSRFSAETVSHPGGDPAIPIDQRLRRPDSGLLWLWAANDITVSMAWLNEPVAGVSRVSGVYTPPEYRGHGYASACVAHTSRRALDAGSRACMLYTDLANPTSNKIYQHIGYRPLVDTAEWTFYG